MARMMADCRRFESDNNCSLTIIGEESEVLETAAAHAVAAHGHTDDAALREGLRGMLEPASEYAPGERAKEALPG